MLRNSLSRLLQSTKITEPARNVAVLSSLSSQKFGTCIQVSQSSVITNTLWSAAYLPNTSPQYTSKRYSGTDASLFKRFIKKMGLLKYSRTVSIFLMRLCIYGNILYFASFILCMSFIYNYLDKKICIAKVKLNYFYLAELFLCHSFKRQRNMQR